ncbi:hypothetical protein GQ43DRAFT_439689 [Delitschia confertaspora ATCC 74209]|uniref:Chorismate synthase protein n=1 Tax=Delitschia confertaspora ATCC 74209 TaxID=1513339 RepID=A0A9P4JNR1_9PLEO|nr:hypothetical protein GQ43DRAFT_439689 [Delitschia confertaspora ATCC 74209]
MINLQAVFIFVAAYFIIPRLSFLPPIVRQLSPLLGPIIIPKIFNFFNTLRATSASSRVPIRSAPAKVQRALNLLFLSAVISLVASLPYFAEENIFLKTQSRLQIQPDVLFARLRMLRPLTPQDEILREKFKRSAENRLIYLAYGPDTVTNCIWCPTSSSDSDANSFFLYTLPKLLTPHIFNMVVLGLATSSFLVGKEGARFRIHSTIAGIVLMVAEVWYLGTYDITRNKRTTRLEDIDFVYWRLRVLRYVSFAALHGILALVLWATATNRWLAKPPSIAERLETTTRVAEESVHKLRALGLLANAVNRNEGLRGLKEEYWRTEAQFMADVVGEEEVVEKINAVVTGMDMVRLEQQTGEVADSIIRGIDGLGVSQGVVED